jgi:hypothetical protein
MRNAEWRWAMKVKAKVDGEINHPQENGTVWGVRFKAGEKITIPDRYFDPKLFVSLEPKAAEREKR